MRNMRKWVCALLLFALLLTMTACGAGTSEDELPAYAVTGNADPVTLQDALTGAYKSSAVALPEGMDTVTCLTAAYGGAFAYGDGILCRLDGGGAVTETYELAKGNSVVDIAPAGNGDLWLLAAEYGDGTQELAPAIRSGEICRYTPGGHIGQEFALPDDLTQIYSLAADPERERLYVIGTPTLTVLGYDGRLLSQAAPVAGGAMTIDGRLAAVDIRVDEDGAQEAFLTLMGVGEVPAWEERREIDVSGWCGLFDGGADAGLYLTDGARLYAMDLAAGTLTPVLAWTDAGIDLAADMAVLPGGKFLVRTHDSLRLVEPVSAGDVADGPVTITAAKVSNSGMLEKAALGFNNAQSEYKLVIRDYSQYNADGHDTAGLEHRGPRGRRMRATR